jgi:hypothetical protein
MTRSKFVREQMCNRDWTRQAAPVGETGLNVTTMIG